jgi:antitoxin (DNA-binding transcriptional repressor) of toxin-antitoxin stability system
MTKVVSIYEAKSHLSQLIKKAEAGETIYVGAYGRVQAVIAPVPQKQPINIGVWVNKKQPNAYKLKDIVEPDSEITDSFNQSTDAPLL